MPQPAVVRRRVKKPKETVSDDGATFDGREGEIIREYKDKADSPLSCIRAFCVECMGGQPRYVSTCPSVGCSLHPLRMGTNPFHGSAGKSRNMEHLNRRGKK